MARRARAVIVHNEYARDRLQSFGVTTPIHVVPHPYVPETRAFDRDALRTKHGIAEDARVIGFFGFLTAPKRADAVLESFRIAREKNPKLVLLIVGEAAPNIDVASLAMPGVVVTGYVEDDEFAAYYAAADRFVNLRYPSAGETSGTLIRAVEARKPVAVSDYAQFAEGPGFKVPVGAGEVEGLVDFFLREFGEIDERRWLATVEQTIDGYERAFAGAAPSPSRAVHESIALFPRLELTYAHLEGNELRFGIRNHGPAIRTHSYDQPEYRLIAKIFDRDDRELQNRWLSLPRDLATGDEAELSFAVIGDPLTLRLYHALQDVPMLEPEPWEAASVR